MLLRLNAKHPRLLMQLGMTALALGALTLHYGTRMGLSSDLGDALGGFFYGIAIASLLLSLRFRRARRDAGSGR